MIVDAVFVGIVATAALDLWALMLRSGFGIQKTNWGMVGRWIAHMRRGIFRHDSIADAKPVAGERVIGWTAHYLIGIICAWTYLIIMQTLLTRPPTIVSAVIFGLATLAAPWFIMQPGMGLGVFARRAPDPVVPRLSSLFAHTIFGASLYFGWRLGEHLLPP